MTANVPHGTIKFSRKEELCVAKIVAIANQKGGVQAVEALVKENPDMTAVFVTNYEMTMGAVIGLNEMGVSLPEEISMVGFDNLPFARACRPALTIVSQPTEKIARETAQLMLARLEGKEDLQEPVVRKLQTDIFMGKSIRRQG